MYLHLHTGNGNSLIPNDKIYSKNVFTYFETSIPLGFFSFLRFFFSESKIYSFIDFKVLYSCIKLVVS